MKKYLLVDLLNTYFRARHMAPAKADTWTKVGMALHITLKIINKSVQKEKTDHVVICLEGRSWRKELYEPYKRNRKEGLDARTEKEIEEDEELFNALADLQAFFLEKTNVTVLQNEIAEADDMIARWIASHPNDEHVIMSSDSDFYQLLSDNVYQYNGVQNHLITLDGIFDDYGKRVQHTVKARDDDGKLLKDAKKKQIMVKEDKPAPVPKWELFEKCIRGDSSDNIFSAYPGVRKKGSKNKVGLEDAFADMETKGYSWNNLMLQEWTDHHGNVHKVRDDYNRNMQLIDLTAQPEEIKDYMDETIKACSAPKNKKQIGRWFMRFCGKYELKSVAEFSDQYVDWLKADYE